MEICAYQTNDKGKGTCYGKRRERWYHVVDSIGLICYNVHILKDPKNNSISSPWYGYRKTFKLVNIVACNKRFQLNLVSTMTIMR